MYRRTLHNTGRLVLAAVHRRSSPQAQPRGPRTTASELFYLKLKIWRVFSIGPSWCSVCVCSSDCNPHLVEVPLHKLAWTHSHSTPSRPCRLRSRTTPARSSWKLFCGWSTKNMRDSWILVNSTLWPQQSLTRGGCSSSVKKRNRWWRRDIGKWWRKAGSVTNFPPPQPGRPKPCRWVTPWIFPLSALLSLGWGTSTLSEMSSLGSAVPDHSSAPHIFLVLHNARACPAAGQSLVAGADTPPVPDVNRLIPHLEAALRPIRERSLPSRWDQWYLYPDEYDMVQPDSFWPGRPLRGCFCFASLKKTNSHCESPAVCDGITAVGLTFQFRFGSMLSTLRLGLSCWVRCCGKVFTWCNKDGVYFCSDSRTQPVPQSCWSWWPHDSLSSDFGQFHVQRLVFSGCAQSPFTVWSHTVFLSSTIPVSVRLLDSLSLLVSTRHQDLLSKDWPHVLGKCCGPSK